MKRDPVAFMSYVRLDDQHEGGRLSQFRERLSGEVRMQTGEAFEIFQDRNDIAWGQQWQERIEGSIDAVTFLIPIVTPAFFQSPACRQEFERFQARAEALQRTDLILPVYYVECPNLDDEARRAEDPLAAAVAAQQYADWRELRFEPLTSPDVGRRFATMARQIAQALQRSAPGFRGSEGLDRKRAVVSIAKPISPEPRERVPTTGADSSRTPASRVGLVTLVVDAFHRGDFPTIGEALAVAAPGTRILLRPGLYKESVLIDRAIEIVGDGELADIVIEASDSNAINFRAQMGRVANVTLRLVGDKKIYCVNVEDGRLDLEGCDLTSQALVAIVAIHKGADPRVRQNRIHDGGGSGIYVYDNGRGTIEDNDIFGIGLAGVSIASGGNPTLRRNRIHHAAQSGVSAYEGGAGVIEHNDIFSNGNNGVIIKEASTTVVRRNRIHDSGGAGVLIQLEGRGVLEDNDIYANKLSGVCIANGSTPTVRLNRIYDGRQNGIFVYESGLGLIEDNEIRSNTRAGVVVQESGNPTCRRNTVTGNNYGVRILDDGKGVFEDNDLRGNTHGSWSVSEKASPQVTRTNNKGE